MSREGSLVTLGDVVAWLRANRFGLTALELYEELSTRGICQDTANDDADAAQYRELLSVAELSLPHAPPISSSPLSPSPPAERDARSLFPASPATSASNVDPELASSIVRALGWYRQQHSAQELSALMAEHGFLPASGDGDSAVVAAPTPLEETRASLREMTRRWQSAEQQHKSLLVLLAQSLPTLVSSIDPMHRDSLLPLLHVVAVNGSTSSTRDSARHQMLTLFKRPNTLQRAEIARAWLQVAQAAPSPRALQQEIIPQLYGLANDPKWERRVLGLDCAAALAPLLATLPNARHQLTQGLLQPLSEDETSAVRKEVPLCLGELWGAACVSANTSPPPAPSIAESDAATTTGPLGTPDQFTYALELTIHLSIDSVSNTVRHAAQTQLREVMFPLCLQLHRLVSVCIPLLLSFLADELTPLCATETGSASSAAALSAREGLSTQAAASLHLRNSIALLNLIRGALRCLEEEIANVRERAPAEVADSVMRGLCRVYLSDTLPSAYSLLPLCLNDATAGPRSLSAASNLLSEPLSAPSSHTRASLLASLALVMASVAPILDEEWWRGIQHFLCASVHLERREDVAVTGRSAPETPCAVPLTTTTTTTTTTDESVSHRRCRLLFFYAYLIRVCGEGSETGSAPATAPASTVKSSVVPSTSGGVQQPQVCQEAVELILHTFPGTNARLANESLDMCARCIAVLGLSALDDPHVPVGITTLLWACANGTSTAVRSQAVTLISRTCHHLHNDEVKVSLICPPLLALIRDDAYVVQEAAVRCLFRVGSFLPGTAAQEKALQPVMDVVQAAGCTSDLTVSFLQYVEELVKEMPSEPRENQLYLVLCVLMDQLADQQTRRATDRKRSGTSTPASFVSSMPGLSTDDLQEQERWETAMLALQSLLSNVLHCAVISPHLVSKFLLPGIKHLSSEPVQRACSSTLRSRWGRLDKAYDLFMENSRSPGAVAAQNATNLLNRVRDEFKKHF